MRIIALAFMLFVLGAYNTDAQTFSPEFNVGNSTDAAVNQAGNTQTTSENDEDLDDEADDQNDDDEMFVPADVNIGGNQEQEKVYDNTLGHVFQYKVVNGKVIFDESKERKVLVFIDNYKAERGLDGIVKCSLRIYVLNDMLERIHNLSFKLIWPEIRTTIQMNKVNPGVRTYKDIMLLGEGCFTMDKTPTIEVNRCRVKGKSQEQCAQAIHWFKQ